MELKSNEFVLVIRQSEISDVPTIRALFQEFAHSLDFELCFQDFDQELVTLPGRYARPDGNIFLATVQGEAAGCVALRKIEIGICEMKRLWVRPAFRRHGIGRELTEKVIEYALQHHYVTMKLDTIDTMAEAISLYRSFGFVECPPYTPNPIPGAVFMALSLRT